MVVDNSIMASFLKNFLTFCLASALCLGPCVASERPNVLLIMADDLRPALGCYGESVVKTANLDNLASKSILFEQAFANIALCGPSRASLLTSRRPDSTRVYDLYTYWRTAGGNFTTLPQHFKENGYVTQNAGKIFHPGTASNFSDDAPYSWTNEPFHPSTQKYKMSPVCPDSDGKLGMNIVCPVDLDEVPEQTLPDIQTADFTVNFLDNEADKNQPFFLAVGFHKPHVPLKYPQKFLRLYPSVSKIHLAPNHTFPDRMPLVAWHPWNDVRSRDDAKKQDIPYPFGPVPTHFAKQMRQSYFAATSYIDSRVGLVLDALDRNGFADNTIVAFIGDHGWSLGERQEWSKYSVYNDATQVPFILYIPGVTYQKTDPEEVIFPYIDPFTQYSKSKSKRFLFDNDNNHHNDHAFDSKKIDIGPPKYTTRSIVELVDLFPTLAEAAGLPTLPTCPSESFDIELCTEGSSLMPLINDVTETGSSRRTVDETSAINLIDRSVYSTENQSTALPVDIPIEFANECGKTSFLESSADLSWKNIGFSQFPRPSVLPGPNSDMPNVTDITIMGYSVQTPKYQYVEWVGFDSATYNIDWSNLYARELYLRDLDPDHVLNVAEYDRCFRLVHSLSQLLRHGWK